MNHTIASNQCELHFSVVFSRASRCIGNGGTRNHTRQSVQGAVAHNIHRCGLIQACGSVSLHRRNRFAFHAASSVFGRIAQHQTNSGGSNIRIKAVRFTHSTAQELRTCAALYAGRYANQVGMMLCDPTSLG